MGIPPDDIARGLMLADPDDPGLPHVAVAGDSCTILLSGHDTAGRCCLIDMLVLDGGGPAPHRHDFEETFTVFDGEIEVTVRGQARTARAGNTLNIPANAPHAFRNRSGRPARLLCPCAPAGQDEFFLEVGVPVASRTTPAPKLSEAKQQEFVSKAEDLAPKYRTELLRSG